MREKCETSLRNGRKRLVITAMTVLFISFLLAGNANALSNYGFINGTVMDSVNKTGISGVTVFINTNISTTTNATGFYSFAVTEGTYDLTAKFEPVYYVNNTITISIIGSVTVLQDIELLKKPVGTITGKVTTALDNTPIATPTPTATPNQTVIPKNGKIFWSGYNWNVIDNVSGSGWPGGGPYYAKNVWVDTTTGYLHLKLTKESDGIFSMAELDTEKLTGYGTYIVHMETNPYQMLTPTSIHEKNIDAGFFYWYTDTDELDIEYSRWGSSTNDNLGQFTVQNNPPTESQYYYINETNTINTIVWHSTGQVDFEVRRESDNSLINTNAGWTYPSGNHITRLGGNFDIDIWSHGAPSDGLEREIVLKSFQFIPETS